MQSLTDFYPLLEAIVSFMDEGVVIADTDGRVIYQNPAIGDMLGVPVGEPIRKLSRIGNIDLEGMIAERAGGGRRGAARPEAGFVRFERRIETGGAFRDLEFHTGVVEVPETQQHLRLVITQDRSDKRNLESILNRCKDELITNDPRMLDILTRVEQVAPSNAFVLLEGESGTGKTHIARMIHRLSPRKNEPFVEVNCAAIPESLIESELFGHVKGAFTGAVQERRGRFQSADKGTLLLDEIGEVPLHLQAKLLKAIQVQEFEMVGSDTPVKVDVRVISATNRDLKKMVDSGAFRADLYYRLAVIPLIIPALRERPGDIPLMLKRFCETLVERGYPDDIECTPAAMSLMMNYPWPGNVREMENAVEHAIVCAVDKVVLPESLPQVIRDRVAVSGGETAALPEEDRAQRLEIEVALKAAGGNRAKAARNLGIDRSTLWRRMQRLGLDEVVA